MTTPALQAIRGQVARDLGVKETLLASGARTREVLQARRIAMALCSVLTEHGQQMIARAFGLKDSGAVAIAVGLVEARLTADERFAREFDALKKACTVQLAQIGPAALGFTQPHFNKQLSEAFAGMSARLFAHMRERPVDTVAMLERGLRELDAGASQLTEFSPAPMKGNRR